LLTRCRHPSINPKLGRNTQDPPSASAEVSDAAPVAAWTPAASPLISCCFDPRHHSFVTTQIHHSDGELL
jgi:hypothetical protein